MRKRLLIISSMVSLVLVASVAWAYWTTEGGGTGTATVDDEFANDLTVENGLQTDPLRPGGDTDVTVTVTNPDGNEGTAYFAGVTGTVDAQDEDCVDADFSIADLDSATDFNDDTLQPAGTATATATIEFADDELVSQDDCKTDTLDITWTIDN
jgi:hypothetical protein